MEAYFSDEMLNAFLLKLAYSMMILLVASIDPIDIDNVWILCNHIGYYFFITTVMCFGMTVYLCFQPQRMAIISVKEKKANSYQRRIEKA